MWDLGCANKRKSGLVISLVREKSQSGASAPFALYNQGKRGAGSVASLDLADPHVLPEFNLKREAYAIAMGVVTIVYC